jgi:hypothetical protein
MADVLLLGSSAAMRYRNGGLVWELFSWACGLRRLGLDVFLVDQLDAARCVFPGGRGGRPEESLNVAYGRSVAAFFGFEERYAVIGNGGEEVHGLGHAELADLAGDAVAFVNLSGTVTSEAIKRQSRLAVYVDTDPGLTQLWLASEHRVPRVEGHDVHFTIGENVGRPGCSLPTGGIEWRHARQPVVLEDWPLAEDGPRERFTTLATLRGTGPHGPLELIGEDAGHKAGELETIIALPQQVAGVFEIAVKLWAADPADVARLEAHGWSVVDGSEVAPDPDAFRRYVQGSGAELSVAKGAFVRTASGWFSDRTTRYLASGKPAVVQDTGFTRAIPAGKGLFAFRTLEDAVAAVEQIQADYEGHSRAARALAEQHFDSDVVLSRFLEVAGVGGR